MHLFLLGWRIPHREVGSLLDGLSRMTRLYPQLDAATAWHEYRDPVFSAGIESAPTAAAPRKYVWCDRNGVTLWDGLMVDRVGRFRAHCADELATHWNDLPESLEGQFVVAQAWFDTPRLEIITDPLGMEQVYTLQQGDKWLVSNSVALLDHLENDQSFDAPGVSMFLALDWVGGDRTLRPKIRVISGGQRLIWSDAQPDPRRHAYFPRAALAVRPRRFTPAAVEALTSDLLQLLRLSAAVGPVNCPISGGRDSRLLTALLVRAGIPARYWTSGFPESTDAQIGTELAGHLGLPHQLSNLPSGGPSDITGVVLGAWEQLTTQVVRQHAGMVSVILVPNIIGQPLEIDKLQITLVGLGGEIARSFYGSATLFNEGQTKAKMLDLLPKRVVRSYGGLIRPEAVELADNHVRRFLDECLSEGFTALDLPDVFYAYERVRRWGGNFTRQLMATDDHFMPFCTRPFLSAAFSLRPLQRYTEPIHYRLIRRLAPELARVPFDKPWRSQSPTLHALAFRTAHWRPYRVFERLRRAVWPPQGAIVPMYDQSGWLENKREELRRLCLDRSSSALWAFISRPVFERLMATDTPSSGRASYVSALFAIVTLFLADREARRHLQTGGSYRTEPLQ